MKLEDSRIVRRPNSWVTLTGDATTVLTYAPQADPAPLMVSVPGENTFYASLEVVITNASGADVAISSITFGIPVGTMPSLTPTTAGVTAKVSDDTNWQIVGPPTPVTDGTANYVLGPAVGSSVTLKAGASVVIQIFQIQTNFTPSTCDISIKELQASGNYGFDSFSITTFPLGFYFTGLAATVKVKSELVPVAQVPRNSSVILVWNASVADVSAFNIFYSTLGGQQTAQPTVLGQWQSPPLLHDTTFAVEVTAAGVGGVPVTAVLAVNVSVQNGDSVITNLTASGASNFTGPVQAAGVTATGLTVNGAATVTGAFNAGSTTAPSIDVTGNLTAGSATVNGPLTISGPLTANGVVTILKAAAALSVSTFPANFKPQTDGFFLFYVPTPPQQYSNLGSYQIAVTAGNTTYTAMVTGAGVNLSGGTPVFLGQAATVPVPANASVQVTQVGLPWSYPAALLGWFIPMGNGAPQASLGADEVRDELLTTVAEQVAADLPEEKRRRLLELLQILRR